jgi:hypothetical protein
MRAGRSSARGASILEVLISSGVLLLGLAGILQMMTIGLEQLRNSDVRESSQQVVSATLAPFQALDYWQVDAGNGAPQSLPSLVDEVGRTYARTVTVTQIGDGGVGAFRVEAEVTWQQRTGLAVLQRTSRGSAIITEVPDAG